MMEASQALGINIASISHYRNSPIPYRGKLFYTDPIVNFNEVFESSKINTPKGLVNKVMPVEVWSYDAKTLHIIKGSPFYSKIKASKTLHIGRSVIDYFLDTGTPNVLKEHIYILDPLQIQTLKILS